MTNAELQRFAYDFVCENTDPGNAGYLQLSFQAAHAASLDTPLDGCTVDEIAELFWAEHNVVTRNFKRARGRA